MKRKKSQGGQGRCEWRSEAFVKIKKKIFFFFFFGGGGGGGSVIVKRKKVRWGVRVDVNGEVSGWM